MKTLSLCAAFLSASVAATIAAAASAIVGPPLICHPFEIGDAKCVAWGGGAKSCKEAGDKARLVNDVAQVLKTERDVIVRMETLRRAALAVGQDRALAWELLGRSGLMVLEQQSVASTDALVWLDTGFLIGCFDQLGFDLGFSAGVSHGVRGYGYMLKAIERSKQTNDGQAASMEFAAALLTHPCMLRGNVSDAMKRERTEIYANHVRRASSGAAEGSLLERNLSQHLSAWGDPRGGPSSKTAKAGG